MRKWLIFPVLLLLLLTACQTVSNSETGPASSTPPSSSITPPPSSSVVPPTSIPSTTPPPTKTPVVDVNNGLAFVTHEHPNVELMPDWIPPSDCLVDHLYWVIKSTKECILVCDEPIYSRSYVTTDTHIYFVKESEPTKVYRTSIGDFANHQLIYESSYGKISSMAISSTLTDFLQFVADEKRFAMLDMSTGESTVLMEQYHIDYAYMEGTGDGTTWNNWICFDGKPTENDSPYLRYFYNIDTGETWLDTSL